MIPILERSSSSQRVRPSTALLHPLWWAALGLLLANDHWLKRSTAVSPLLTGKLSDVSGLLMAPALFAALLRVRTRGAWLACHAGTAAAFALLKLSAAFARGFVALAALFGLRYAVALDPSDLWALAAVAVSHGVFAGAGDEHALSRAWARVVRGAGMAVGLVGTVATSRMPAVRVAITPNEVHVIAERSAVDVLDAATGRYLRSVPFDAAPYGSGELAGGLLAMHDGRVLDLATGRVRFQFPIGESTIGRSERLWIGCLDARTIGAFDVDRGALIWKRALHCDSRQARLSNGVVALFDGNEHAELLETATGRSLGRSAVDCPSAPLGTPSCHRELFELEFFHPEFRGFHFETNWSRADAELVRAGAVPLLVWMYTRDNQSLAAFQPGTRASLWSAPADTLILTAPNLVVTSREDVLEGRDTWSGAVRWRFENGARYPAYAANDTTLVFYRLHTEQVIALDQRTGRELWATKLPLGARRAPEKARDSR